MRFARTTLSPISIESIGQKDLSFTEIRHELKKIFEIQKLRYELRRLRTEYIQLKSHGKDTEAGNIKNHIEQIIRKLDEYFDARIEDSPEIRSKIETRDSIKHSMNTRTCSVENHAQSISCGELLKNLERTEGIIIGLRNELFWSEHSLHNFRSDLEHPYPGYNQPAGDYIDVKSVVDGGRHVALVGRVVRPVISELVAEHNLSCLTARGSDQFTIFYDKDSYEIALHIAEILETRGDESGNPETIYQFHKKLGELMGINAKAVEQFAILARDSNRS